MYSTRFLCVTALASILHYVSAVTLEPIPPPPRSVDKRAANAALDLQSSEVFLWGARGKYYMLHQEFCEEAN